MLRCDTRSQIGRELGSVPDTICHASEIARGAPDFFSLRPSNFWANLGRMSKQEWAVQDEVTGEWWTAPGYGATKNISEIYRFRSYPDACSALAGECAMTTARVVPAPPREMTDAECWEWFKDFYQPSRLFLTWITGSGYGIYQWGFCRNDDGLGFVAKGNTPCDAIRAAYRKLESK